MFNKKNLTFLALLAGAITVSSVAFWPEIKRFVLQDACLDNGGKWATNGNYCIHRHCAEDNSCKPSYRNNAICETLQIGISQSELYFHLGMPESNTGNTYTFTGGGAESRIEATIKNGVVSELECGT